MWPEQSSKSFFFSSLWVNRIFEPLFLCMKQGGASTPHPPCSSHLLSPSPWQPNSHFRLEFAGGCEISQKASVARVVHAKEETMEKGEETRRWEAQRNKGTVCFCFFLFLQNKDGKICEKESEGWVLRFCVSGSRTSCVWFHTRSNSYEF